MVVLHTNSAKEIVNGLTFVAKQLEEMATDAHAFKWVVIGIDNVFQNAIIACYADTTGTNVLPEKIRVKVLAAIQEAFSGKDKVNWPVEKLLFFDELLELALDAGERFVGSQAFTVSAAQRKSIESLHEIRNRFIHYRPVHYVVSPKGYCKAIGDVVDCIHFLIYESGNFIPNFDPDGTPIAKIEMEEAFARIRKALAGYST